MKIELFFLVIVKIELFFLEIVKIELFFFGIVNKISNIFSNYYKMQSLGS